MLNDVVISNKTYAKLTVPDEEFLDDIAMKTIRQDMPGFLLPVRIISINGKTEIRYEVCDGIRLSYLAEKMKKSEFLVMAENMLRPFRECNDWFLDYHKFYLNPDYIMIAKDYSHVRYVYRFENEYIKTEEDILDFFREFILKINLVDDQNYILNLYRRTKDRSITLKGIMDYILQENMSVNSSPDNMQEKKTDSSKKLSGGLEEFKDNISNSWEVKKAELKREMKAEESVKKEEPKVISEQFGKEDVKGSLLNNLFGEEPEEQEKKKKIISPREKNNRKENSKENGNKGFLGGLFGNKKESKGYVQEKAEVQPVIEHNPINQKLDSPKDGLYQSSEPDFTQEDVTVIGTMENRQSGENQLLLKLEDDKGYQCPKYMEIDLTKGYATIGRYDKAGIAQSDYNFDSSLSFISRRQCRIEKRDGQAVIIDLGSGNGTLVNDVVLAANMPCQIYKGDRVIFSKNKGITYIVC